MHCREGLRIGRHSTGTEASLTENSSGVVCSLAVAGQLTRNAGEKAMKAGIVFAEIEMGQGHTWDPH